jgi:hypothetical protein
LEPNLAGMFLGWSSTKLLFFVPVGYSTWKQKIFKNLETAYSEKIKEYWNILKSMKKKPVENINEEIFLKCFIVNMILM